MRILVTGGCGFIGANFVRRIFETDPAAEIVNLDALTYAGNLANLEGLADDPRRRFVRGDVCDAKALETLFADGFDAVVHFAAESHVDRSILDADAFVRTNVVGTHALLEAARRRGVGRFVHVSTDEVYGSLGPEGFFTERTPLDPRSPYSATKAASDHLALAYWNTYGVPVCVTRCCNNYGPYQFPEKLIPLMILNALRDEPLPVYGDGRNVRDWIYVLDHCAAVEAVMRRGRPGEVYNIGARCERENLTLVREILAVLGKPESLIQFVTDRPGHDRRYAVDPTKIESELGWRPEHLFTDALRKTVEWYLSHRAWWEGILSGEYLSYYDRLYTRRDETLQRKTS